MAWDQPSLPQLNERIGRDFSSRLQEGAALLPWSVEAVLAKIWAGAVHLLHFFLAWCFRQCFPDTAEGYYAARWASVWYITRKDAATAVGRAAFKASSGALMPAGTLLLYSPTGAQYRVTEDARESGGYVTAHIAALEPGAAGNLAADAVLALISPVARVNGQGTVGVAGISGGVDEESDDSLRQRLLERLRRPPRGGAAHDYEFWAKEVAGVTRAWCYAHGNGIGTVSLCFVCDADPVSIYPSPEMVARVRAHIDAKRPVTVKDFEVFAPEPFAVRVTVRIRPPEDDSLALREEIRRELADLFWREGEPGGALLISHIREAVSISPGEWDHIIVEPGGDVEIPAGCLPELDLHFYGDTESSGENNA